MKEQPIKELRLVTAPRRRHASNGGKAARLTPKGLKTIGMPQPKVIGHGISAPVRSIFSEKWLELVGFSAPQRHKAGEFLKSDYPS